ncbi:MAG: exodeoxyribonuclease VII small subunit [Solirubrobacteraceae bacterium]
MTTTNPIAAGEPTELPFEQGYERLQTIASRLNEDEVPVSEMCDLFAEGKGLELALTEFLDTQRQRVEAIERGEGIRTFRISGTQAAQGTAAAANDPSDDDFVFHSPSSATPRAQTRPASRTAPSAIDDNIPF